MPTEAQVSPAYRGALLGAKAGDTVMTSALSGRPARALRNELVRGLDDAGVQPGPFPGPLIETAPARALAARRGDAEGMALWAGAEVHRLRTGPAAALIRGWGLEDDPLV